MNPEVLLLNPSLAGIEDFLLGKVTSYRAWDALDLDKFLNTTGPRLRGLVTSSSVDAGLIARLPFLEIIAKSGVGYEHIDVGAAIARNVMVTNTPDVLTDEVADFALGLMIATVRRIPAADRYLRSGEWARNPFPLTGSLRGKTVGIAGLGRIGHAIAIRCRAFGLNVVYYGRSPQREVPYPYFSTLAALASAADILVVCLPGSDGTNRAVDVAVLEALGRDGVLINVGRGSVIDQNALIQALAKGTIASAGLDVFEEEPYVPSSLLACDNVVLTPHVASASVNTRRAMLRLVADNLLSWFAGSGPVTPIAETDWRPSM